MEVHPPEHAIHNWRDFFIHIGTITIGLLIAIGLEQTVEYVHHRHQLHTAENNLRSELANNRNLVTEDRRALDRTQGALLQHLAAMQAAQSHRPVPADPPLQWSWNGPQSAAWDTARDGGAISLMSYEQASSFAIIYAQQKVVEGQAALYVRDLYNSNAALQGNTVLSAASPETLTATIADTQHTLADLRLLRDYSDSLLRIYDRAETL